MSLHAHTNKQNKQGDQPKGSQKVMSKSFTIRKRKITRNFNLIQESKYYKALKPKIQTRKKNYNERFLLQLNLKTSNTIVKEKRSKKNI